MGDHLIVLHSAVRACPGYDRHDVPSMFMDGNSLDRESEHGRAVTAQLSRRHETLGDAIDAGSFALSAAGVEKSVRRQARTWAEDYFYTRLGLAPDYELKPLEAIPPGLELMPEPMYKALEEIVEAVVEGVWVDLREFSGDKLGIEDMRRRVEDEVPELLELPPRELYRVEAITKSDDPDMPGWAYFLELWTEDGTLARLHLEGEIEEGADKKITATLNDILP